MKTIFKKVLRYQCFQLIDSTTDVKDPPQNLPLSHTDYWGKETWIKKKLLMLLSMLLSISLIKNQILTASIIIEKIKH